MRRLLLGVPLVLGLGVIAPHAGLSETISEGMDSSTYGVFGIGSYGSGAWAGEIQSQGMQMSNGIFYSQGMQISNDYSGGSSGLSSGGSSGGSSGYGGSSGGSVDTSDSSGSGGSSGGAGGASSGGSSGSAGSSGGSSGYGNGGAGSVDTSDFSGSNVGGSPSTNLSSFAGIQNLLGDGTDGPGEGANLFTNNDDHGDDHGHGGDPSPRSVPEPMTLALLGTALLGFGLIRRMA